MSVALPPYAQILGLVLEPEAPEGGDAPVLAMPFGGDVLGRPGFVHGGALSGLLEMAAITALKHALEQEARGDARIKPVNVTVDFMRGGREKTTRAQGKVSRLGNRVANVEAFAWQDDPDRPVAAARMNFLIG
ncbi:PaaI family thioesterase [Sphingomonas suaedae]|uniref:PaaI family thioesterase n=1 Tax=Sphingomonas suaedae TaxID=2599297 RepID=A0A518RI72_9SPHN|nr:PaaI family thioesterase [Sphingomonas suaedae]QDX27142.1 PaaI family thioesterase [Sphingomonas suaedae]